MAQSGEHVQHRYSTVHPRIVWLHQSITPIEVKARHPWWFDDASQVSNCTSAIRPVEARALSLRAQQTLLVTPPFEVGALEVQLASCEAGM